MEEKPQFIQTFERPAGIEIKLIHGHYYQYEPKSVYGPATKCKKKVGQQELREIHCVECRACSYLYQANEAIKNNLKWYEQPSKLKHFPKLLRWTTPQ